MHQILNLRSLAFILASAIRRARALSCASLQCFAEIGRNMATNMAKNRTTSMCTLLQTVYTLPKHN